MNAKRTTLTLMLVASLSIPTVTSAHAAGSGQQFADLGKCELESGKVIEDCRIGYRTWGTLNADKSNAVLVLLPVWQENENSSIAGGYEALWPDTAKHFVIVIDPVANKVSIGPNNSKAQPGAKFPKFTVRDMVEIDRRVLKEALKLDRVNAILGENIGGMQALEWMVAYPDEMDKVIAIAATPKATAWDMMAWQAQADIMNQPRVTKEDDRRAAMAVGSIISLILLGPQERTDDVLEAVGREVGGPLGGLRMMQGFFLNYGLDRLGLYASAIASHDIYRSLGGTPQKAAEIAKAKLLAMVLPDDLYTSTGPMIELAKAMDAEVVELSTGIPQAWLAWHDGAKIRDEVRAFLAE